MAASMTAKHYEMLAKWAGEQMAHGTLAHSGVEALAELLRSTNPLFSVTRFVEAAEKHRDDKLDFDHGFNEA